MPKKAYIQIKQTEVRLPHQEPPSGTRAMTMGRCPRCRRGKVFQKPFYHPGFARMNNKCPHCKLRFEIEPGFFWGAMYVNYALSVLLAAITGGVMSVLINEPSPWTLLAGISAVILVFSPLIFRVSRILLIYFLSFIPFEPARYRDNMHQHN